MCFVIIIEWLFWFLLFYSYDSPVNLTLGCKLGSVYHKSKDERWLQERRGKKEYEEIIASSWYQKRNRQIMKIMRVITVLLMIVYCR